MDAYIKPIITKSDENNIVQMRLVKAAEKPLISYDELDVIKKEIGILKNHIKGIDKQIRITTALQNDNIKFPDEIHNISCKKTKVLLTDMENYIAVLDMLPKAPPKIIESKTFLLNSECDIDKITEEEVKEEYYNFARFKINKDANDEHEYKYIQNLTNEQLNNHYNFKINSLDEQKLHWQNILDALNKIIYQAESSKGLATSNDLRAATMGAKKDIKWYNIGNEHRKKVKELLKSTAPEILEKLEDDENSNEIISQFIGIKLKKKELRILKTIRGLVDRAYKLGEIQDYGHKVRIYTDDFYKEYGFKRRKEGGYDDNQTRSLREILFGSDSNLTKRIFFNDSENQRVLVTSFVLKIEWTEKNNYFDVILDDIIFVKDKADQYSYYYEDLKGFNRLLELMPNSDAAFNLHGYFEYSIKSKEQEFGLTKLLNHSGIIASYNNKQPTRTIKCIEKVLDNMVKANTLISGWQKTQGKNEIKYILTNIRYEDNIVKLKK